MSLQQLVTKIKACTLCEPNLSHGANPILSVHEHSKILIIGQAPGLKVHQTGIPWNDASGDRLRTWLQLDKDQFYDEQLIAIMPMAFCYPGRGKSGDLPPPPICAKTWHQQILQYLTQIELTLLIGQYAQNYYLPNPAATLTENVRQFNQYLPKVFPLPHPSPRNNIWLKKNSWFEQELLPELRTVVQSVLSKK